MDIQGMRSTQTPKLPRPAFAPPVAPKAKRSWGKIAVMVAVALLVLALLAGAAYGGYYWERARATKAENDLRSTISKLQNPVITAQPAQVPGQVVSTVPACASSSLVLAEVTSNGAAGTTGITYSVTNKSAGICTVSGYPTVTLADSNGKQIGQAAQPSSTTPGDTVSLQPNDSAYLTVLFPNPANYAPGYCSSTKSSFIKVLPTGQTNALQVALSGQVYCTGFMTQAFTSTAP